MATDVLMPQLSEATQEGILVTWFVKPGAPVREGDLVAEVQVEKMSSEVRAPASGRIGELRVGAGDVVVQGGVLATIDPETAQVEAAYEVAKQTGAPGVAGPGEPRDGEPATDGRLVVSPSARRLARELGVNLAALTGSGPGGRIIEADVRAAAVPQPAAGSTATASASPAADLLPITAMRRTIADRLRQGLVDTAQLTLTARADVTELAERLRTWGTPDRRASYTEAAVRACALAIRDEPRIAARWTEAGLLMPARIDVGVAVALDDGLVVPVVRAADGKSIEQIGNEIADYADRARAGHLEPGETDGAVFSVTNLGRYGIDAFTPLVNPPQAAILGLGQARPEPAVVGGAIVPRMLIVLSLTFDHRVLDGAPAAAFLAAVVGLLEAPGRL